MNLKLKKSNNQIYIVDVDAEIVEGDIFAKPNLTELFKCSLQDIESKRYNPNNMGMIKVITTPEQIDIDNLWEKYLEALADEYATKMEGKGYIDSTKSYKSYLQAKQETCFSSMDLIEAVSVNLNSVYKGISIVNHVKLSKIPECGVEIKMEEYKLLCGRDKDGNILYDRAIRPKLTNNKVTITTIIL